jgi:hypothetical protein
MKKALLVVVLAVMSGMGMAKSEAEQFGMRYIATSPGTNYKIYNSGEFMFIDARATGRFASISIPVIQQQKSAGYAIVPARNFDELNKNGQFAQGYVVDCGTSIVYDADGQRSRVSELNQLHQSAADLACMILDAE